MCKELNPLRGVTERMLEKLCPIFEQLQTLGVLLDQAGEEKLAEAIMKYRRPAKITSLNYPRPGGEIHTHYKVWAPDPDPARGDLKIIGEGESIAQAMLSARRYYDQR